MNSKWVNLFADTDMDNSCNQQRVLWDACTPVSARTGKPERRAGLEPIALECGTDSEQDARMLFKHVCDVNERLCKTTSQLLRLVRLFTRMVDADSFAKDKLKPCT